jgi:rRNA maturation protein Nop10
MDMMLAKCLGCGCAYAIDLHACPQCGSHARDVAQVVEPEPETPAPRPQRKPGAQKRPAPRKR